MDKVVYIKAPFAPVGKTKTVKVPVGEKNFWKGQETRDEERFEQTGWSDSRIDGEELSRKIQQAITELNATGFEVISVTNITSGVYNSSMYYSFGYSYTVGVIVIARKV